MEEAGPAQAADRSTPPPGARKIVTLVFADLAGSTSLQERMDAESVRRVMDRFYEVMRTSVTVHSGTVVKFMGDGLMAAFGVPTVAEDDAVRAVRAAAAMQDAFVAVAEEVGREWDAQVGLRVGVNTGEVVVAEGEDDVVGDAVNVAARLEQAAGESEVLVGQETWRLTRDLFTFEEVPPLELKGKAEAVPGYRLVSLTSPVAEGLSPFVGRERELARLSEVFEVAVGEGRAHLVTVIGSPGLGKSRLVRELALRVGVRARTFEGQCEASGASTFAPVADVLRQAAGIEETASADEAVEALAALFSDDDGDSGRITTAATTALGLGGAASPEETFWAVRRVVERVAARQPAIVVFDDVHWAEPLLLDLLDHLAEWTRDAPVLLVALARPEIRDVRPALADPAGTPTDVLVLDALPAEEGIRLASELLEGHPVDDDVAARLLASAEGNPLFLRELVKMLLEDGVLHLEDGVWVTAEGADVDVPPTIHALLSARIERLDADDRSVVERASVVGHQFFRGAVAVLSPPAVAARIDSHLETLRRKEVVEPEGTYWIDEPVFRFHHALIRDAAYRRLLKESRAELHEQVAEWLAAKAGDVVGEHEEVVGYHLEQAFEYRRDLGEAAGARELGVRAAGHLAAAARRSLDRDDLRAAAGLMGRAVTCLPPDDTSRAELLLDRCEALLGLGEVVAGREALAELEAASGGSPRLAAWAEAFAAEVASFSEPEALPEWVGRAAAAADRLEELGDPVGAAKAAAVHASILVRLGQVGAGEAALDRALAAAREAGDRRRANGVLAGAPLAALWGPSPVTRAAGRCLDVVRVLRITTDSPPVEAVALRAQGVLEAFRGRFDAARRLVGASRRTLEELGLRHGILQTDFFAGLVELAADDAGAAEAHLREAYEGFRALGVDVDTAQAAALLARSCLAQGRDDEALELTRESERLGGHDLKTAIAWRAVRADALARRGEADEALRLAREAVDLAAPTDALVDHADARLALAAVLAASDDSSGSAEEARRAAELYETKGAAALVERAQRLAHGSAHAAPSEDDAASTDSQTDLANLATTAFAAYARLVPEKDVEGVVSLVAPEYVLEERGRRAQTTTVGHDGVRRALEVMFEADCSTEFEVLATRGQRLSLVEVMVYVRDPFGGNAEHPLLRIDETNEEGLLIASVTFDPDDLDAAYDELDRRWAAQVGAPQETLFESQSVLAEAYASGDSKRILDAAFASPDVEVIDHRRAGWGHITAAEFAEFVAATTQLASVVELRRVADFRRRGPFMVVRQMLRGTGAEGETFELVTDTVARVEGGRLAYLELYDPEDLDRALSRFDELTDDHESALANAVTAVWDRYRHLFPRHDVDGILATVTSDYRIDERQHHAQHTTVGRDRFRDLLTALFHGEFRGVETEALATRGDRLALVRVVWHVRDRSGGEADVVHLRIDEANAEGRLTASVVFDADDLDAAFDELDRRYAEHVDPSCRPVVEAVSARRRALNARDWDGLQLLLTDDYVHVSDPLRPSGILGEQDAPTLVGQLADLVSQAPDRHWYDVETLRLTPDGALHRGSGSGTGPQGIRYETATYALEMFRAGKIWRTEIFHESKRAEALACFDQLTAGQGGDLHAGNLALEAEARTREAVLAGDLEGVLAATSDNITYEERTRTGMLAPLEGTDALVDIYTRVLTGDVVFQAVEVLATRGDRLALQKATFSWQDDSGMETEHHHLRLDETDGDGKIVTTIFFEAHDIDAALDELDERFCTHLDQACRPVVEMSIGTRHAYNERDWDRFRSYLTDDFVVFDHRPAGWGEIDADTYLHHIRGLMNLAEVRQWTLEVPRIRPRGMLSRSVVAGAEPEQGTVEFPIDILGIFADGKWRRFELFDFSDHSQALARFEELTADELLSTDLANGAARAWERHRQFMAAGDVDAIVASVAEDITYEERKRIPGQFTLSGKEALREMLTTTFSVDFVEIKTEVLAIRGGHLALTRNTFRSTDPLGGTVETLNLRLDQTNEAGLITSAVVFDPDDLGAAFEELEQRYLDGLEPAHRPPFELAWVSQRSFDHRDWDALRETVADDFRLIDRRLVGYGERDGDQYVEGMRAMVDMAPDVRSYTVDVILLAPTVILSQARTSGTDGQGGRFEQVIDNLGVLADGRWRMIELFDPAQRDNALARFAELAADQSASTRPSNLAVEAWGRARAAMQAGDVAAVVATMAEDGSYEERRSTRGRLRLVGREQVAEMLTGMGVPHGAWSIDAEVVATRGTRLALTTNRSRLEDSTGGVTEYENFRIDETDEAGSIIATVLHGPDDVDAAMDELDERYLAHVDPDCTPLLRTLTASRRAHNRHDLEALGAIFSDDYRLIDHRTVGWGECDRDGHLERVRGLLALAPDLGIRYVEVVRLSPRLALVRTVAGGTEEEGGPFESHFDMLVVYGDGRFRLLEFFDPSQRSEALVRFDELATETDWTAGNLALQSWERAKVSLLAGDVDRVVANVVDDVLYEERRATPGRFTVTGRSELAQMLTTMARNPAAGIDTEALATRGRHLVLTRNVFSGSDHRGGGEYETAVLRLDETDEVGRFTATIVFEPEDVDIAMDELDERFHASLVEADRPMFDRIAEARRLYNGHDWDGMRRQLTDDFVLVDHRPGWFGTLDADAYIERMAALPAVAPDASITVSDVPRIAPNAAVIRWLTMGTGHEGGVFEITFDSVAVRSGYQISRLEFFDVGAREEALKRFEELVTDSGASSDVAMSSTLIAAPNEAMWLGQQLTEHLAARDVDAVVAHHSPDVVVQERRHSANEDFGRASLQAWAEWGLHGAEVMSADLEPLAIRGENLLMGLATIKAVNEDSGGEVELSWLVVNERDSEGLLSYVATFEPDDFQAALDELDRRFESSVPAGEAPVLAIARELMRTYRDRDWEGFRSLHAADYALIDHRPTGWGECDLDGYVERLLSLLDLAPDVVLWIAEIPRLSVAGAVFRTVARGNGLEGGPIEIVVDHVSEIVDGKVRRQEYFPPERRDDAVARFDEMAGLADAGNAVRTWARVVGALHENDVDSVVGLVAPDYRDHDHVLDVVTNRDEQIENQHVVAAAKGLSIEWDCALDLDRVAVVHVRYRWSGGGGSGAWSGAGPGEFEGVMVVVLDDARQIAETHRFAEDQLYRALAFVEERHAGIVSDPNKAAASRRFARIWNLVDAYNQGDWATLRTMWADDMVTVDHRPAGWGTIEGGDRYVEVLQGLAEVARDRRWVVHDLLHRGDRALAARWSVTGTDQEGGPFEMVLLVAFAFDDDGRVTRQELFPIERLDETVATARAFEVEAR